MAVAVAVAMAGELAGTGLELELGMEIRALSCYKGFARTSVHSPALSSASLDWHWHSHSHLQFKNRM